ncbi:hypothetical protein CYLTODRAFT_172647 [Cylindrobasidium torrendii FP15055 ss-10]|uniref:Uncharacterized protein n=1 Tax=Cylindrobasidium torrendii FP15055 ss-10 TaxID=1314674 RepID=A0A0D7BKT7_9AGAR|nr:hypothetical protein CYLTODRAFT_172647 [Cylindrobasidium torrendii FP15055 ss-10]
MQVFGVVTLMGLTGYSYFLGWRGIERHHRAAVPQTYAALSRTDLRNSEMIWKDALEEAASME